MTSVKKISIVAILIMGMLLGGWLVGSSAHAATTSVCTMTGLTGAAQQENLLYCATNLVDGPSELLTGVTVNEAPSTYVAAITLAKTRNIVVGTPMQVSETVDWTGVQVTDVEFSRGYHAEHYNPSNGHVRIYDPSDHLVFQN